MWNENFQEVMDELKTTLDELAPNQRAKYLQTVYARLQSSPPVEDARTLTAPTQQWMLR